MDSWAPSARMLTIVPACRFAVSATVVFEVTSALLIAIETEAALSGSTFGMPSSRLVSVVMSAVADASELRLIDAPPLITHVLADGDRRGRRRPARSRR